MRCMEMPRSRCQYSSAGAAAAYLGAVSLWATGAVSAILVFVTSSVASGEDLKAGEAIYRRQCASCHGKQGEGVDGVYDEALTGDQSVSVLSKYIDGTMPEENPDACMGEDAANVAAWLHQAFYSREAQLRLHPPEKNFSRRTVAQTQNAIYDILDQLYPSGTVNEKRGLVGKYFHSKKSFSGKPHFVRTDALIRFDFGSTKPEKNEAQAQQAAKNQVVSEAADDAKEPGKKKREEHDHFSIRWSGGVIAPQTGKYEFIVTTENACEFSVNGDAAKIDNKVNVPGEEEFRSRIAMVRGRGYPLSLSISKTTEATSSIALEWIRPDGVRETVPPQCLTPNWFAPSLVLETQFPPDDSSIGYARGTSVSKQWDAATTSASLEVLGFVENHFDSFMRHMHGRAWQGRPNQNGDVSKGQPANRKNGEATTDSIQVYRSQCIDFAQRFVEVALGRPLTPGQRKLLVLDQFEQADSEIVGVKRVILLTLKSPQFLYPDLARGAGNALSDGVDAKLAIGRDRALLMANVMWDSIPDARLRDHTDKGRLTDEVQLVPVIRQMVQQPRTRQKLNAFFRHWMEMDKAAGTSKDPALHPGFDKTLLASLERSLEHSIEEIVWSDTSDYRKLFSFEDLYVDRRMAEFYQIASFAQSNENESNEASPGQNQRSILKQLGEGFQKVRFESDRRSGILTHPFLMAGLSYYRSTSPIHRGVFVAKSLLGRSLKPPPIDVEPLSESFDPNMTTRERVAHQTQEVNCIGCHSIINPLGFPLENFDAVGKFRDYEKSKPIDATTVYLTPSDEEVRFSGARDLANYLIESPDAQRTFVEKLFQFMVKQSPYSYGPDVLDELHESFVSSEFNIQQLLIDMTLKVIKIESSLQKP